MEGDLLEAIKRTKEGDQDAATKLYHLTSRMVYFTALKITGNEDAADDITQDTYIKAFNGLQGLRDCEAFISWIKTIAVNLSKDYMKKARPILFKTRDDEEGVLNGARETNEDFLPEEYADKREKSRLIMAIVDSLPETQRVSVILYYYNGLSIAEVSKIMETSEGTTKSRLSLARKYIKDRVEDLEKKGAKLYGVPALLLSRILNTASLDYSAPEALFGRILAEVIKTVKKSATISEPSGPSGESSGFLPKVIVANAKKIVVIVALVAIAGIIATLSFEKGEPHVNEVDNATSISAEASSEEAPVEEVDTIMEINVDGIFGMRREDVLKLLGSPDSGMEASASMDKNDAIDYLWDLDPWFEEYFGLSKEEAKAELEEEELEMLRQSHALYKNAIHLAYSDYDSVMIANFLSDKYSFLGVRVGMTKTEALSFLNNNMFDFEIQSLGLNHDAVKTPNESFKVGDLCELIMYLNDDGVITEFTVMP